MFLLISMSSIIAYENRSVKPNHPARVGDRYIGFDIENDAFIFPGRTTDQYYTNGIQIRCGIVYPNSLYLARKAHQFERLLYPLWLSDEFTVITLLTSSFAQNMYTPDSITISQPQIYDRPYAGWTRQMFEVKRIHGDSLQSFFSISLGSLGEAGAATAQSIVHYTKKVDHPEGWHNHIKERIALQVSFGRIKRVYKSTHESKYFQQIIYNRLYYELGNVFIRTSLSYIVSIGVWSPPTIPLPSSPGMDKALNPTFLDIPTFAINLFLVPKISLIAYNGTLDPKNEIVYRINGVPLVLDISAGIEGRIGNRLEVQWIPINYRSIEYLSNNTVPDNLKELIYHGWAQISATYKF